MAGQDLRPLPWRASDGWTDHMSGSAFVRNHVLLDVSFDAATARLGRLPARWAGAGEPKVDL
jgi:hypothetical protein